MVLCDCAVTPTVLPWATSSRIIRAAVQVLPVPGGPWMGRTLSSRSGPSRMAASDGSSPGRARASVPHGALRSRGGRRSSRARAARNGPSPSMPSAMTASATRATASLRTLLSIGLDGKQGGRVRPLRGPTALEGDQAVRIVEVDDRAGSLARALVEGGIARIEPVVLGLEAVLAQGHPAVRPFAHEGQPADGVTLADELLDGQVLAELVPAPPLRLLLAAMPVEQAGQQAQTIGALRWSSSASASSVSRASRAATRASQSLRPSLAAPSWTVGRDQSRPGQRVIAWPRQSSSQSRSRKVETQSSRL